MLKIHIEPEKVWDYFQEHKGKKELVCIAENQTFGAALYMEIPESADEKWLTVFVLIDDIEYDEEVAVNAHDCKLTVNEKIEEYLTANAFDTLAGLDTPKKEEKVEEVDQSFEINAREMELEDAFDELLMVVCEDRDSYQDIIGEVVDDVLEYLYRRHNIDIYRPTIMVDENGGESYEEYPYSCMIFEDEEDDKDDDTEVVVDHDGLTLL